MRSLGSTSSDSFFLHSFFFPVRDAASILNLTWSRPFCLHRCSGWVSLFSVSIYNQGGSHDRGIQSRLYPFVWVRIGC